MEIPSDSDGEITQKKNGRGSLVGVKSREMRSVPVEKKQAETIQKVIKLQVRINALQLELKKAELEQAEAMQELTRDSLDHVYV